MKQYQYMYYIGYRKPTDDYKHCAWYGGNTEAEAKQNAIESAVKFHNQWNKTQITELDINIVECELSGEYDKVMKELSNDRS